MKKPGEITVRSDSQQKISQNHTGQQRRQNGLEPEQKSCGSAGQGKRGKKQSQGKQQDGKQTDNNGFHITLY